MIISSQRTCTKTKYKGRNEALYLNNHRFTPLLYYSCFPFYSLEIEMNITDDVSTMVRILEFDLVNPDGLEVASELTSLACITVLALTLGIKTYGEQFRSLSYGRVLVILLYTSSWAFATTSIIVVSTNNSIVSFTFICISGNAYTSLFR